jgi:transcriptional regulator with XRE-family HTH domain
LIYHHYIHPFDGSQQFFHQFDGISFLYKAMGCIMVNVSKIENLIKEKGWKIPYFCSLFDKSRTWISDWKRGRGLPDENTLVLIADRLDTTVDYLTDETDDKKAKKNKPSSEENSLSNDELTLIMEYRKLTQAQKEFVVKSVSAQSDK